jgi:hypothetical protein
MKWVVTILVIALAAAAGFGWKQVADLQRENARLRGEVATLQANVESATASRGSEQEAESRKSQTDAQELLRLRNEVAQLRTRTNELQKLQAQVQAQSQALARTGSVAQATNQVPTLTGPTNDHFPRQNWNFAGYATPEAALVSAIWAMREGKPQVYLDSLSPQEQQRMAQAWQNKSEQEIATKHQGDVANINELRIVGRQNPSPNQVQLQVNLGDANRTETVTMENIGGQWKFGGFVRQPQQ